MLFNRAQETRARMAHAIPLVPSLHLLQLSFLFTRNSLDDLVSAPINMERIFDFEELRFWRTRFALVPVTAASRGLTSEETRTALIRFIEDLNRIIRQRDSVRIK